MCQKQKKNINRLSKFLTTYKKICCEVCVENEVLTIKNKNKCFKNLQIMITLKFYIKFRNGRHYLKLL